MNQNKRFLILQTFVFSLYLSCWNGVLLPKFIETGSLNFSYLGVVAFFFFAASSLSSMLKMLSGNRISQVVLFCLLLCTSAFIFPVFEKGPLVYLFISLIGFFQGFLTSQFISKWLSSQFKNVLICTFILGLSLYIIPGYIDKELFSQNSETSLSPVFYLTVFYISILLASEFFNRKAVAVVLKKMDSSLQELSITYIMIYILAILFVALEILYIFWSLVLSNDNQDIVASLTFPSTLILVFVWRIILYKAIPKIANLGWLFLLSLGMTISLGLLYTFNFTIPFILIFSASIAFLVQIHNRVFNFEWDKKRISVAFMVCAVGALISGFYIQNHVDFIKSINMPESVITLSAKQTIIKEIASFSAIAVVITGYLFIKRRTLFQH